MAAKKRKIKKIEVSFKVSYLSHGERKTGRVRKEEIDEDFPENTVWEIVPDDPLELGPRFRYKRDCEVIDTGLLYAELLAGCSAMAAKIETSEDQTRKQMNDTTQTLGQRRVHAEFNPSKNDVVDQIKNKSAELIDLIETLKNFEGRSERNRQINMAQSAIEVGCMHGVKACFAKV